MQAAAAKKFAPEKKFDAKGFFMKYAFYFILVLLIVVLSCANDKFLTYKNIIGIFRQISIQALVAIGMTMVILIGQIDLSVGSLVAFGSIIGAMSMKSGVPVLLAILVGVAATAVFGFVSGLVVAKFNVHAFLVTLAMMTGVRGLAYIVSGGYPVSSLPDSFTFLGGGYIGPIPVPVVLMFLFYGIFIFILNCTRFGRSVYAVGGNSESARLSGINVRRVKILVFTITAALSGLAGMVLSSRLMSGAPDLGNAWEMDCITGVIIGGTNMNGGEGKLQGTLVGMLFVGVLSNGMVLLGINDYLQQVIKGLIIFAAVIMNSFQAKRAS